MNIRKHYVRRTVIERPYYLEKLKGYTGTDIIRVITGVRRCGKTSMLQSILDSILFNDVRPKVGSDANNETITRLVAFLNDSVGYPVSMNNLEHRIKSSGYKMYHDLIRKYMSSFKSSFLYQITGKRAPSSTGWR